MDIHDLWYKRWAKVYCDEYIKNGAKSAKTRAVMFLKDKEILTKLVPYIQAEFTRRGYSVKNPTPPSAA